MILRSLLLQNFRNYPSQKFEFSPQTTIIIGINTAGKTNLVEAIAILATGKGFKGQDEEQMIQFGKEIGRVQGMVEEDGEKTKLEVAILSRVSNQGRFGKKFFVNGVAKNRFSFRGFLPIVLFRPEELDIVIAGPSHRRAFLDDILEQVDRDYYHASVSYEKALRQRNALLQEARETGVKGEKEFVYWDNLVIENGQVIFQKRDEFLSWLNRQKKEVFDFQIIYDHSKISKERLLQYNQAEIAAGVTLVGPHRDDFYLLMQNNKNIKDFGSRGQQRLTILQIKLLQIQFLEEQLGKKPLLVLDDIFSELDSGHIELVLEKASEGQRIITTTHKEFINKSKLQDFGVIELGS